MSSPLPPVGDDWLFEVVTDSWAYWGLPRGSLIRVDSQPRIDAGAFVLAIINGFLVLGRWFSNIAGFDWLLQPTRIIQIGPPARVRILGVVSCA